MLWMVIPWNLLSLNTMTLRLSQIIKETHDLFLFYILLYHCSVNEKFKGKVCCKPGLQSHIQSACIIQSRQ